MLTQQEQKEMNEMHAGWERAKQDGAIALTTLQRLWMYKSPFKVGDTTTLGGVTYVVTGFSGSSDNPLTGVEIRPVHALLNK